MFERYQERGALPVNRLELALDGVHVHTNNELREAFLAVLNSPSHLTFEQYTEIARQAASNTHIVDYIPLEEIKEIACEAIDKDADREKVRMNKKRSMRQLAAANKDSSDFVTDFIDSPPRADSSGNRGEPSAPRKNWREAVVSMMETLTGLDIDGDGKADMASVLLPDYDLETQDVHIVITTIENGHNRGRIYDHKLQPDQTQEWADKLTYAVKDAKLRIRQLRLTSIYGHSKFSMFRAKTRMLHQSNEFAMLVAFFIVTGFIIDIAEAQVMPAKGSNEYQTFVTLDAIITTVFAIELIINLFANRFIYGAL